MSPQNKNFAFGFESILILLLGTAMFVASIAVLGNHLVSWLLFSVTAIWFMAELLTISIPKSIVELQFKNCIRMDGSWSNGREAIERRSVGKFRYSIATILFMLAFPTLFGLWITNREIIPLSIGFDAVTSISGSREDSKANLVDEGKAFDRWHGDLSSSRRFSADDHKRFLWDSMPVFFVIAGVWALVVATIISRCYLTGLKELRKNVLSRGEDYYWRDMSRQPPLNEREVGVTTSSLDV